MDCTRAQERLLDEVDAPLAPAERGDLLRHLEGCETCKAFRALQRQLDAELRIVAVKVVKHEYQTKHKRKYVGSKMETDNIDYDRKQRASVMLFSCGHPDWRKFTPEYVAKQKKIDLLQFNGINSIGELSADWNWLADEYGPNDDAKIIHWTAGIPLFPGHKNSPLGYDWLTAHAKANYAID